MHWKNENIKPAHEILEVLILSFHAVCICHVFTCFTRLCECVSILVIYPGYPWLLWQILISPFKIAAQKR